MLWAFLLPALAVFDQPLLEHCHISSTFQERARGFDRGQANIPDDSSMHLMHMYTTEYIHIKAVKVFSFDGQHFCGHLHTMEDIMHSTYMLLNATLIYVLQSIIHQSERRKSSNGEKPWSIHHLNDVRWVQGGCRGVGPNCKYVLTSDDWSCLQSLKSGLVMKCSNLAKLKMNCSQDLLNQLCQLASM